jgi:hypothetical protein
MVRRAAVVVCLCLVARGPVDAGPKRTNLSHLNWNIQPSIVGSWALGVDRTKYDSFTIFRTEAQDDPRSVRLLTLVQGFLMQVGYEYAAEPEDADLVLVMVGPTNEYRTVTTSPSKATVPRWQPGFTILGSGGWNGQIGGSYTWGTTSSTITVPGRWRTGTYTVPSRTVGSYYPTVGLMLIDPDLLGSSDPNEMIVWSGNAVGCTQNPDVLLTAQMLLHALSQQVEPTPDHAAYCRASRPGTGISWALLTPHGDAVWPTVLAVLKDSPADKAGVKPEDIITAVDGEPTTNLPTAAAFKLLRPDQAGEEQTLTIQRLGKVLQKRVTVQVIDYGKITPDQWRWRP